MSKQSKKTDISSKVKKIVFERDNQHCIYCGSPLGQPNAHYIRRSHGGLGIEENIVTLCWRCHYEFDNYVNLEIGKFIENYLKSKYPNWDKEKLIYGGKL